MLLVFKSDASVQRKVSWEPWFSSTDVYDVDADVDDDTTNLDDVDTDVDDDTTDIYDVDADVEEDELKKLGDNLVSSNKSYMLWCFGLEECVENN